MGLRHLLSSLILIFATDAVQAQPSIGEFTKTIQSYWANHPIKKTNLILSQNKFVSGDTARLKIFYTDNRNLLIPGVELIHLELMDRQGNSLMKNLLKVNNGMVDSYFVIPDITEGIYRLVCYSNYMRNFPANTFGSQEIIITAKSKIKLIPPDITSTSNHNPEISIRLNETSDSVEVLLKLPNPSFDSHAKIFAILVAGETTIVLLDRIPSANYTLSFSLKELTLGLNQIFMVNHLGQVIATNSFLNQFTHYNLSYNAEKIIYKPRERVQIDLNLTDASGTPTDGNFTIKVVNPLALDSTLDQSIHANKLFEFNLPWDSIAKGTKKPHFKPSNVIERRGLVLDTENQPVPDNTQILFLLQNTKFSYQTTTYQKGRVNFTIPDFVGSDDLFYMAQIPAKGIIPVKIEWDEDTLRFSPGKQFLIDNQVDTYAEFSHKRKLIDQSFDTFQPEVLKVQSANTKDFEATIASADISIKLKDYKPFLTMAELIKEILPSVWYRKISGTDMVRVSLPSPMNALHSPVYVVDGAATLNTGFILNLNPNDLEEIKVINNPRKLIPLGLLGKNGIIIIKSKRGNIQEKLPSPATRVYGFVPDVNTNTQFVLSPEKSKPIFRSTIYWNPTVKMINGKARIEFNLTDDVGILMLSIEGYTSQGEYIYKRHPLKVSANGQ